MCEPTLLLGLSVASTLAGAAGANSAARSQADAINQAAKVQQGQINAQASQDKFNRLRQGNRERASAAVSAGESGVGGASVRNILMDSLLQQSFDTGSIETNRGNQVMASHAENTSRVNSLKTVSALETGLAIGTTVASSKVGQDAYNSFFPKA